MKKILISAYAVSPIWGSECAVGWQIAIGLAKYFEVTVVFCKLTPTNDKYFDEVEAYFLKNTKPTSIQFVPVEIPFKAKKYFKWHDAGFWPAYYWGYNCWQKEAYKVAVDLHESNPFDLAYQLNMIGFREPGYLWKLPVPFVWGPTNGFHSIPFSFLRAFQGKEYWLQCLKHIANEIQIMTAIRPRKAAKRTSLVFCVDQKAQKKLHEWGATTELLQETGLSVLPEVIGQRKLYDGLRTLNLVWSGMITPGKALFLLIEALVKLPNLNFHLTVLGDGELLESSKKIATPIADKISWKGWLDKEKALELVKSADLLIHTSLKEGTPHSILEAIGLGVPVMCHDTCGMGIVVNDKNGFKIPYRNKETTVDYIVSKLQNINNQPEILNSRFQSIFETTDSLTWERKVAHIANRINDILNSYDNLEESIS